MVPEVSVLLSTFNGACFLRGQLQSVIAQSYRNLVIYVRDDGSTDETRQILANYANRYSYFHADYGERMGVTGSFFRLLKDGGVNSEYFALCDQDDVWSQDKIQKAVSRLNELPPGLPGLYCSRLEYVDQDAIHIGYSPLPRGELSFANALVESSAIGCTVVLNRAARDIVIKDLPRNAIMHDWWCYLVVSALGKVIYDAHPTIKYRLHGANQVGVDASIGAKLVRRLRRFSAMRGAAFPIHQQAKDFAEIYSTRLTNDKRIILSRFLKSKDNLICRLRFAMRPHVYRQSRVDNIMLRALIALGWY